MEQSKERKLSKVMVSEKVRQCSVCKEQIYDGDEYKKTVVVDGKTVKKTIIECWRCM